MMTTASVNRPPPVARSVTALQTAPVSLSSALVSLSHRSPKLCSRLRGSPDPKSMMATRYSPSPSRQVTVIGCFILRGTCTSWKPVSRLACISHCVSDDHLDQTSIRQDEEGTGTCISRFDRRRPPVFPPPSVPVKVFFSDAVGSSLSSRRKRGAHSASATSYP